MNRKIIQISNCGVANNQSTQCNYVTVALCDDGTVWENRDSDGHWREYAQIPQYEIKYDRPA